MTTGGVLASQLALAARTIGSRTRLAGGAARLRSDDADRNADDEAGQAESERATPHDVPTYDVLLERDAL